MGGKCHIVFVCRTVCNKTAVFAYACLGEFKECTILFSDVVTFTNICSQCEPIQIVRMLNSMYLGFDRLTTVHNVYKVHLTGLTSFDTDIQRTFICKTFIGDLY